MKILIAIAMGALTVVGSVRLQAQREIRTLAGVVVEKDTREPIVNALISIEGVGNTYSDYTGHFSVRGPFEGTIVMKVRRIGFGWVDAEIDTGRGGPLNLIVELPAAAFAMDPISVTITDPNLTSGRLNGFLRRIRERRGRFVTRRDIERRRPQQISDMFSRYRRFTHTLRTSAPCGLRGTPVCPEFREVRPVPLGWGAPRLHRSTIPCNTYYVNNLMLTYVDINLLVDAQDVLGIEIYRSNKAPLQFRPACRGGQVIVMWTE